MTQREEFEAWYRSEHWVPQDCLFDAPMHLHAWKIWQAAQAAQPAPTVPDQMQDWKGMDGTTAWHLIERHSDNWADVGKMMGEWLAANQTAQPAHAHAIDTSPERVEKQAGNVQVPGWLPIESAPKDGARVLIKADCIVVAGWQNVFDETFGWVVVNDVWIPEHMATHWRPINAALSTKEKEQS